ncbi:hypothetical protein [Streptomyces sp. NPDC057910]|uniref:hypothetical protein n=1 Tax=Streptomyces sp. NPDC057910 TaxID=3346278 RepID=UPI0036E96B1F
MKKIIRDNYRVEVLPDTYRLPVSVLADHRAMCALLADVARAVRRHVDGIDGVLPLWDTREECSHCECGWEVLTAAEATVETLAPDEHSVEGEPVCCEAGINEFRAERGIPLLAKSGGAA